MAVIKLRSGIGEFLPRGLKRRPVDHRGYPVPWFVTEKDEKGNWEFRGTTFQRLVEAISKRVCWVCGDPLDREATFVAGPMCGINRTSAEPPVHHECAIFSATVCPFLTLTRAQRRDAGLVPNEGAGGTMIRRNPGVTMLWTARKWELLRVPNGLLHRLTSKPKKVEWYSGGRRATRAEVNKSIDSGLPYLLEIAAEPDGTVADVVHREIERKRKFLSKYLPRS